MRSPLSLLQMHLTKPCLTGCFLRHLRCTSSTSLIVSFKMPDLVLFHLLRMCFAFISVVVIAAFWTIQYSDHITVIFDNTIISCWSFRYPFNRLWALRVSISKPLNSMNTIASLFTSSILSNTPQLELLLVPRSSLSHSRSFHVPCQSVTLWHPLLFVISLVKVSSYSSSSSLDSFQEQMLLLLFPR